MIAFVSFILLSLFIFLLAIACITEEGGSGVVPAIGLVFASFLIFNGAFTATPWEVVESKEIPHEKIITNFTSKGVVLIINDEVVKQFTNFETVEKIKNKQYSVYSQEFKDKFEALLSSRHFQINVFDWEGNQLIQ